jgi:hypothetical protein
MDRLNAATFGPSAPLLEGFFASKNTEFERKDDITFSGNGLQERIVADWLNNPN